MPVLLALGAAWAVVLVVVAIRQINKHLREVSRGQVGTVAGPREEDRPSIDGPGGSGRLHFVRIQGSGRPTEHHVYDLGNARSSYVVHDLKQGTA